VKKTVCVHIQMERYHRTSWVYWRGCRGEWCCSCACAQLPGRSDATSWCTAAQWSFPARSDVIADRPQLLWKNTRPTHNRL